MYDVYVICCTHKCISVNSVSVWFYNLQLKDCRDTLQAMQTQDGPHLGAMMAQLQAGDPEVFRGQRIRMLPTGRGQHQPLTERFQEVRRDFIQEILDNLESRFPQVTLLNAMQVKLVSF